MDRIVINIQEKGDKFVKRVVLEVKTTLQSCDFITIGDDIIFDKDTDFFTFGFDITGNCRHIAIVTGEYTCLPPKELVAGIKDRLADRFEIVSDDEEQIWMREK